MSYSKLKSNIYISRKTDQFYNLSYMRTMARWEKQFWLDQSKNGLSRPKLGYHRHECLKLLQGIRHGFIVTPGKYQIFLHNRNDVTQEQGPRRE